MSKSDSPRFIQLSELPVISIENLKNTDQILMASLNDKDKNIFAKTSVDAIMNFYKIPFMRKLNIQTTYYPYLYSAYCDEYDYSKGIKVFNVYRVGGTPLEDLPIIRTSAYIGGCSAVYKNLKLGHNVDKPYNDLAGFIITTPMLYTKENNVVTINRHATIGTAIGLKYLTKKLVDSRVYNEQYDLLPYYMRDGMNDAGLCIVSNELYSGDDPTLTPDEQYYTSGTHPEYSEDKHINAMLMVRVLLDKCSNIDEVITEMDKWNIWCPCIEPYSVEYHWMVVDKTGRVVVIELVNNEVKVIENNRQGLSGSNILTNFYLWKYDGNTRNILFGDDGVSNRTLTTHSRGLERYYLLYNLVDSIDDMLVMLNEVNFGMAYVPIIPMRYSDYIGDWSDPYGELTIHSKKSDFDELITDSREFYTTQLAYPFIRLGRIVSTNYSVVYDIESMAIKVFCSDLIPSDEDGD